MTMQYWIAQYALRWYDTKGLYVLELNRSRNAHRALNSKLISKWKNAKVLNPRHLHLGLRLAAVVTQSVHRPVCKPK